ncbi:hypothetical protein V1527DRAFT_310991 [Lipomyces starkeyi]
MANTVVIYWAISTMLWPGLCRLYQLISSTKLDRNPCSSGDSNYDDIYSCTDEVRTLDSPEFYMIQLLPLEHRVDFVTMARNVAQSVEYCMKDEMLGVRTFIGDRPAEYVIYTLREYPL